MDDNSKLELVREQLNELYISLVEPYMWPQEMITISRGNEYEDARKDISKKVLKIIKNIDDKNSSI